MFKKVFALLVAFVALINFLLFVFLITSTMVFWTVLIICAIIAYTLFPKQRKE